MWELQCIHFFEKAWCFLGAARKVVPSKVWRMDGRTDKQPRNIMSCRSDQAGDKNCHTSTKVSLYTCTWYPLVRVLVNPDTSLTVSVLVTYWFCAGLQCYLMAARDLGKRILKIKPHKSIKWSRNRNTSTTTYKLPTLRQIYILVVPVHRNNITVILHHLHMGCLI